MKKIIFKTLLLLLLYASSVFSDDAVSYTGPDADSAGYAAELFIQNLSDKVTLHTFVKMPIMPISIKPSVGDDESPAQEKAREDAHLHYLPNLTLDAGAGISWKWFGGSYAHQVVTFGDAGKDGRTSATDIRLYMFKRKFAGDLFYFNYKGFHLAQPSSHGVSAGSSLAKRTDLRYRLYEMNLYYINSDDFSLAAAFEQTERQEHWDWFFMAMLSAVQYSLKDSVSLIPVKNETAFGDNAGFKGGVFRGIAAGPGFGLTIPWRKYFLTTAAFFGSGYMNRRYEIADGAVQKHDGFYRINVKASAGYNGDTFFWGNSFMYNGTGNYSGIRIVNNTYTAELFTGIRL